MLELVPSIVDAFQLAQKAVARFASTSARHPFQVHTKEERVRRAVHHLLLTWS